MIKQTSKKMLSLVLAIILVCTSLGTSIFAYAKNTAELVGKDIVITDRHGDGVKTTYHTDYNEVVKEVKDALLDKATLAQNGGTIKISFAVTEDGPYSKYYFDYAGGYDVNKIYSRFISDVYHDALSTTIYNGLTEDAIDGYELADADYLYHSIMQTALENDNKYFAPTQYPYENYKINDKRIATIEYTISNIHFYTTLQQDAEIKQAVEAFNQEYIKDDYTDYQKVKAIYDFVVRNVEYDKETSKTSRNEVGKEGKVDLERYLNSHSAYGALFGEGSINTFDISSKEAITGDKVLSKAGQGRAVCEGYSKLFYLLCRSNNIPCKMIDGDFTEDSGRDSNAHEWNCVYLKDEEPGSVYKWYWVDTTYASQESLKVLDFNSYDYFLRGKVDSKFDKAHHPQPYHYEDNLVDESHDIIYQINDWYGEQSKAEVCVGSDVDYKFSSPTFADVLTESSNVMICRSYTFEGSERGAYLLTNGQKTVSINIDEDGNVITNENLHGFMYNNQDCTYTVSIPYVVNGDMVIDKNISKNWKNVSHNDNSYKIEITGKDNTKITIPFKILGQNMGNLNYGDELDKKYYSSVSVDNNSAYTGSPIKPEANIKDGYKNQLVEGIDYQIDIYADPAHTQKLDKIQEMGNYYIDIAYINNYGGHYYITYNVGKIDLAKIKLNDAVSFPYYPKGIREQNGMATPYDYVKKATTKGLTVGTHTILNNIDYTFTVNGDIEYNDEGTIIMTGKESQQVKGGTVTSYKYKVNVQYNLNSPEVKLDGTWADNKNTFDYTGKEVCPTKFAFLDTILEQGKDYKIVGYENNIKPSTNESPAYVIIEGINGCTGRIKMKFAIVDNRKNIVTTLTKSPSLSGNTLKYTLTDNTYTLVKNVDYTEKYSMSGSTPVLTLTGLGNYTGVTNLKLDGAYGPTSSGNYITLSYTSTTYTGKALKPTVKVYNKNKKQILSNLYTVSYSANTNVGVAKVTVKFLTGQPAVSKTFTINPKGTTLSKLTPASKSMKVYWKKYATQTKGYQIQYSTSSKFSKPTTITISKNSTTTTTIKKLSKGKKYYFRIRTYNTVSGKKYYSSWSKALSAKAK